MTTKSNRKQLKALRQPLATWEPGAFLYATFGAHLKAGFASAIPFGILFFTTQPLAQAMTALATGGYTVLPVLLLVAATVWAAVSYPLLGSLKFVDREALHYLAYALVGAVLVTIVGIAALGLGQLWVSGSFAPQNNSMFGGFLWGAPLLGVATGLTGRWALSREIYWYRKINRPPLADVLEFVPGKIDKNEFR